MRDTNIFLVLFLFLFLFLRKKKTPTERWVLFEGSKSRFVLGGFVALLAIFWVVLLLVAYFQMAPNQDLETLVTVPNIMTHLEKFEEIAIANSNTRAVEFGYNDSAAYVLEQLTKKTSFTFTTQSFFGITYTELNRPLLSQVCPLSLF